MKSTGIYIHIPFCERKCIYCDFYSVTDRSSLSPFLKALIKEIEHTAEYLPDGREISTVFLGGGTPSLLGGSEVSEILETISAHYPLSANAEITLESNPGTLSLQKLKQLKSAGINRLSVGIQSFHEKDLRFLTRIHTAQQAEQAVNDAAAAGFDNINVDLIFNLPSQSTEEWYENLTKAVSLPINHLSAYSLIIEEGTPLAQMIADGNVRIGDDNFDAGLYAGTIAFLAERGFYQYEVSNFAREGMKCLHNLIYWNGGEYFGFGPSAHSYLGNVRSWNYRSVQRYIESVMRSGSGREDEEKLTRKQERDEYIMLALRAEGIDLQAFQKRFGSEYMEILRVELERMQQHGLLRHGDNHIRLTPRGYAVCDEIIARLT